MVSKRIGLTILSVACAALVLNSLYLMGAI